MTALSQVNPDFLKSLEAEIPRQIKKLHSRRIKITKGKSKWQRDLEKIQSHQRLDPHLRKINDRFMEEAVKGKDTLVCPSCGDSDYGNIMNGKPWCMKCNVSLEPPFFAKKRLLDVKVLPKSKRLDITFRGLTE